MSSLLPRKFFADRLLQNREKSVRLPSARVVKETWGNFPCHAEIQGPSSALWFGRCSSKQKAPSLHIAIPPQPGASGKNWNETQTKIFLWTECQDHWIISLTCTGVNIDVYLLQIVSGADMEEDQNLDTTNTRRCIYVSQKRVSLLEYCVQGILCLWGFILLFLTIKNYKLRLT